MSASTESTSLNLLTKHGAICATFTPALTAEQYDHLLAEIKQDGDETGELAELLHSLGKRWGRAITIDPC